MRRCAVFAALLLAALFLVAPGAAFAQQSTYSKYEQQAIDMASKDVGAAVDPAPEGKIIEEIVIRRLDVLEERDPLPHPLIKFLDWFHATSLPFTIERELLIQKGDAWQEDLVEETARNLRKLPQLSVVLCVPVKGSKPDRVKLVVITKDVWSLRLNSNPQITSRGIEELLIQPSEENLGGTHQVASVLFDYLPATLTFGAGYTIPRIADSRLRLDTSVNFIVNKHTAKLEGSYGSFSYGQPLYSIDTKWSYGATLSWLEEISRRFVGVDEVQFHAKGTPKGDVVPYEYSIDQLAASFSLTRSFGRAIKHNVSGGVEALRQVFRTHLDGYDPVAVAEFERVAVPNSDVRVYPYISYQTYETRYMNAHDVDTLGLEENFRLGHDFYVKFYPVAKELASSRSYLGLALGASYTLKLGDGFGTAYAQSVTEASATQLYDGSIIGGVRVTSPRFYIGRLVFDSFVHQRYKNFLNRHTVLGGSDRLRGYPTGAFIGEDAFAWNFEWRTRPIEIFTLQLGFVAFWDSGATYNNGQFPDLKHDVGAGIRVLFPQFDRSVLRVDWGFPLVPAVDVGVKGPWPGNVVVKFDQAFPVPGIGIPSVN